MNTQSCRHCCGAIGAPASLHGSDRTTNHESNAFKTYEQEK